MAMDVDIVGGVSGNKAEVDSNNNVKVNLPTTPTQAGFTQLTDVWTTSVPSTARKARITVDGDLYTGQRQIVYRTDFNNAVATTPMSSQWLAEATTMAMAVNGGFLRLNSGSITTVTTGVQMHSCRTFNIEDGAAIAGRFTVKTNNGAVTNKQFDLGFGMSVPVAGQGNNPIEFTGFRWTTGGAFIGVLEYSVGGASTAITVNLNGGVPLADSVTHAYEVIITNDHVEFWIDNVYANTISMASAGSGLFKANGYPLFMRAFNSASAPALAPSLDIADVSVLRLGPGVDIPQQFRQVLAGRHSLYQQTGLTATDGSTALVPASGTAPTAGVGSNTATTFTGLGGVYRCTLTGVTGAHVNVILSDYTNPNVPVAVGAANDARNLVITDIMISPTVVSTALTGGGFIGTYFVAVGGSAVSLATTTANGTTAVATKAPRILMLTATDNFAATAAAGTVGTRTGDSSIVVHPGEHLVCGFRVMYATAAVTAGAIDGSISFSGYWD